MSPLFSEQNLHESFFQVDKKNQALEKLSMDLVGLSTPLNHLDEFDEKILGDPPKLLPHFTSSKLWRKRKGNRLNWNFWHKKVSFQTKLWGQPWYHRIHSVIFEDASVFDALNKHRSLGNDKIT